MNILIFLKPKAELDLVYEEDTIGEALECIERHQFSSIPIINKKTGKYVGTISEGDFLRELNKNPSFAFNGKAERPVTYIRRRKDYKSVSIDSNMEEVLNCAKDQNFVPVVDDTGVLIGIVTRTSILEFIYGIIDKYVDKEKANLI